MSYLTRLVVGFRSLLIGMGVTWRHLFQKPVTQQYPREKPEMSKAYRSAIAFRRWDDTGTHTCVACDACAKICPSFCITVEGVRSEGIKGKRPSLFLVDYALCSVCGLCIDVCPTDALIYSKGYDATAYRRDAFVHDLMKPFLDDEARYLELMKEEAAKKAEVLEAKKAGKAAEAEAKKATEPVKTSDPGPDTKEDAS